MSNQDAIRRLKQKVEYLQEKLSLSPSERQAFYINQDIAAMDLAVSALEYIVAAAEYEASATPSF